MLREFKGEDYVFGLGCFDRLGGLAASLGKRASVVTSGVGKPWGVPLQEATRQSLAAAGVTLAGETIPGAAPNAPREDVARIAEALAAQDPDVVVSVGGGSGIDAVKCALARVALADRYPNLDDYFGMGEVTRMLEAAGRKLKPLLAVELAASSGSHLTKYANVTDMATGQKLLIVDEAVVPQRALFDYAVTTSMSPAFTMDGALDGVSHCFEVFLGIPAEKLERVRPVALLGIELILNHLRGVVADPGNLAGREALGLGTDLGGMSIMIGGTNGAHLTSFSLTDILPHGRACALMNPYYAVFFAPAIEDRIRAVGTMYRAAGYTKADFEHLRGRDLGLALAEAMIAFSRAIGFPTTLGEVPGFTPEHIARALAAAKNPKLESKLRNMPVPLTAAQVDDYMGPVLEAARTGDFGGIRCM
jgi:alcohol dehydrogenase class IV